MFRNELIKAITQYTWLSLMEAYWNLLLEKLALCLLKWPRIPMQCFSQTVWIDLLTSSSSSTWQGSSFDTFQQSSVTCEGAHRRMLSLSFLCGGNNYGTFLLRSASCLDVDKALSSCVISQPNGSHALIVASLVLVQILHWLSYHLLLKMMACEKLQWACWKTVSLN